VYAKSGDPPGPSLNKGTAVLMDDGWRGKVEQFAATLSFASETESARMIFNGAIERLADAADPNTAARAAIYVQQALRHDYDLAPD
jgi:hypothetical protein